MADIALDDIIYRQGKLEDVSYLSKITYETGWPLTYELLKNMFASCPQAFFVAEHKNNPIGHIMGDVLEDEAFLGPFIVDDKYQRRGIGGALFRRCLEALGDRNVTLYATPQGAPYYKKHFGFKPTAEKPRMGVMATFQLDVSKINSLGDDLKTPDKSFKLVPLKDVAVVSLVEYDTKIHVVRREKRLQHLRSLEHAVAAVISNQVVGYGCLHARNAGDKAYLLAPLLTNTPQHAQVIAKELLTKLPEKSNVLTTYLADNPNAAALMTKLDLSSAVPIEMLYTRYAVAVPLENIYCLESPANSFA